MATSDRKSAVVIGVVTIASLALVGYVYGALSTAPAGWFKPCDLFAWVHRTSQVVFSSMLFILILPPVSLLTWAAVFLCCRWRPPTLSPQLLLLLAPIIPMLAMPIFGSYFALDYQAIPPTTPPAETSIWPLTVLQAMFHSTLAVIGIVGFVVIFSERWHGKRKFAFAVLSLVLGAGFVNYFVSALQSANHWL